MNCCRSFADGGKGFENFNIGTVAIGDFHPIAVAVVVDRQADKIPGKAHRVEELAVGFTVHREDGSALPVGFNNREKSGRGAAVVLSLVNRDRPVGKLSACLWKLRICVNRPAFKCDLARIFFNTNDPVSCTAVVKIDGVDVAGLVVVFEWIGRADYADVTRVIRGYVWLSSWKGAVTIEIEVSFIRTHGGGPATTVVNGVPNAREEV